MDPLAISRHLGKLLNVVLGNGEPFRRGEFATNQVA